MAEISKEVKLSTFKALNDELKFFEKLEGSNQLLEFLETVWPLKTMPSEDPRFEDAYEDIVQHTVRNYDWDIEYLFLERLKLVQESEDRFSKFIETIISPRFRENEDEIIASVYLLNDYLKKDGLVLVITDYDNSGNPIYSIQDDKEVEGIPTDVKKNDITFFVEKDPSGNSGISSNHSAPPRSPSFVLVFNKGWNDYGFSSSFDLFFYNSNHEAQYIGHVKIMSNQNKRVISVIPDEFNWLDESYCSLGQSLDYYSNLKKSLANNFQSVLFALKDSAFFPKIQERFEGLDQFKASLIRFDEAERLLREARYEVYEHDLNRLYQFQYAFKPNFSNDEMEVDFEFDGKESFPNRIYALIGKNGTGKTQLITSLPIKILQKDSDRFHPKIPIFSKVIAVSYSIFDRFEIPTSTASFNYVYCGLRKDDDEAYSERGLVLRFHNTWKKIKELQRIDQWRKILKNFLEDETINEFIVESNPENTVDTEWDVNIEGFNRIKNILSSGQSIILYIISEIVANIRYDSLLLYDEPETHLHPNAITQLMNTIYELVNEFESYCIIATHSPLIVRELPSRNVYVMERNENVSSIRKIGLESFGENLTTITEEIFGNRSIPKQYKKIIEQLVEEDKDYEEILSLLESNEVPMNLNTRIYIRSLISQ